MKLILLLLLVIAIDANLRFMDFVQLQRHHHHKFDKNNQQHQALLDTQNLLRVHMIPHSHDDVGWLKTVDEYYFGQKNDIQWAGIQYIIDSYVDSLLKDPTKKFMQVEIAFFKKWWFEQSLDMQNKVKVLVKNKQLEFVSGGWCMNDEATPYYEDIIDQMTLGHKFLLEQLGVKPTIGWQIDPFGHSSTQAAFSSLMGFNAWFFSRIDYQDKEVRLESQTMEMVMRPLQQSGEDNSIFSHVQYYHYEAPPGFNFDGRRTTEPIIDDETSKDYNLHSRALDLVYYFKNQTLHYKGNTIMHTFGSDFEWDSSPIFYKNLDKLMVYINNRKEDFNIELLYSTPSSYIEEINKAQQTYPTKDDDFFPYADRPSGYWTGYFTSRVATKGLTRQAGRYTQVVRRLFSQLLDNHQFSYVNNNKIDILFSLNKLEEAMGILQHHDAVSGTEKQHVNDDYIMTLCIALDEVNEKINNILYEMSEQQLGIRSNELEQCNWNTTANECYITYQTLVSQNTVQITLLESKTNQIGLQDKISVKVPNQDIRIIDQDNQVIYGEILCSDLNDRYNCNLYFLYTIKSGVQYFKLIPSTPENGSTQILVGQNEHIFTQSEFEIIVQLGSAPQLNLSYGYYESYQDEGQKSGAYIFRPSNYSSQSFPYGKPIRSMSFFGNVVSAVSIIGFDYETIVRLFNMELYNNTYEVETFIGSINVDDGYGKEVVILFNTQIQNKGIFYTDSNGLELQKRQLNYRPTWNLEVMEPSSGNYYPVNGAIMIQDNSTNDAVAVVNDRSQGGTSLQDGQIEIMIHRRTLLDDSRGVGEPLNETNPDNTGLTQRVIHLITFFNRQQQPNRHRQLQFYIDQPPYNFYSITTNEPFQMLQPSPQLGSLDELIQLNSNGNNLVKLYLQPYINNNTYIFRVHNLQEDGTFQITFPHSGLQAIETTLTGNQALANWREKRLKWNIQDAQRVTEEPELESNGFMVKPMQIRTFALTVTNIHETFQQ